MSVSGAASFITTDEQSFNKTEAAVFFPCRLCFMGGFPFLSLVQINKCCRPSKQSHVKVTKTKWQEQNTVGLPTNTANKKTHYGSNKLTLNFLNVCCAFFYVCFCVVQCVCFCTGHFVMVPLHLTCLHCLQHSFFEQLFSLYYIFRLLFLI